MTATYLLHPAGLSALNSYLSPQTLLAFDLDGTLAPIVADYAAARVDEPMRRALQRLGKLARVVVLTGRARQDARAILGLEPDLLIGNHGAEWPDREGQIRQYVECCKVWEEELRRELAGVQGVELEFKGASISLHYRKANDRQLALSRIEEALQWLSPPPKWFGGKFVVNLLPQEALTKGEALVFAMNALGLTRAIFFGDDVTDEEVFRLQNVDVLGIHIGKDEQTAAAFYLGRQTEMLELLAEMAVTLEGRRTARPA